MARGITGVSLRPLQLRPVQPLGQEAEDGLRSLELYNGDEDWSTEELHFPAAPGRALPAKAKKALLGTGTLMVVLLLGGSLTLRQRGSSFSPEAARPPSAAPNPSLASAGALTAHEGRTGLGGDSREAALARERARRSYARVHVEQIFSHMHMVVEKLQDSTRQCGEAEEEFQGLCYKQCSLLTGGQFPIRAASGTCRRATTNSSKARLNEVSMSGRNCSGYAVGAIRPCPHEPFPSECDNNEENYLGFCYKKCTHLTNGEHPVRRGSNVCCTQEPCMNVSRLRFHGVGCAGFGVGGGFDGHNCAHLPDRRPGSGSKAQAA